VESKKIVKGGHCSALNRRSLGGDSNANKRHLPARERLTRLGEFVLEREKRRKETTRDLKEKGVNARKHTKRRRKIVSPSGTD